MSKENKENKKKVAPQKKEKQKSVKKAVISPMVHVDQFLEIATDVYDLNYMHQAGFKAFMSGKQYLTDMDSFVPYLNEYLDK